MRFYFKCLALLCGSMSMAQNSDNQGANETDSLKLREFYTKSEQYRLSDMDKARYYTEELGNLAKKLNSKKGLAYYSYAAAHNKLIEEDFESSIRLADKAAEQFLQLKDSANYIVAVYIGFSARINTHEFEEGLQRAKHVLSIINKDKYPIQRAALYNMITTAYKRLKQYDNAIASLKVAFELYQKAGFNRGVVICMSQLSAMYFEAGDYDNAYLYAKKLLSVRREVADFRQDAVAYRTMGDVLVKKKKFRESVKYFLLSKESAAKVKNDSTIFNHTGLVEAYYELGLYDKVVSESIQQGKKLDKNESLRFVYSYFSGLSYLALKEVPKAFAALNEAVKYAELFTDPDIRGESRAKAYDALAKLHKEEDNANQSLSFENLAQKERIDLLERKHKSTVANVLAKYRLGEKNKAIRSLSIQKQNEMLKAQQRQNQLFLTLAVIAIISILLVTLYSRFRTGKRNAALLHSKNLEITHANANLSASLSEKQLLLKEIHHRVKNNLQLVISLLSIQSSKFDNKELNDFLESGTGRIISMALIHENLYQTDNVANINFPEYAQSLIQNIIDSMADTNDVKYNVDIEDIAFDIQKAIPLGLILNELVVNTIKHNYTPKKKIDFEVSLKVSNQKYEFSYFDPNAKKASKETAKASFGLELINLLAAQLDGTCDFLFNNGLTAKISF